MDPQIGQVGTPVAGSTSRKLAQPLVRQNSRVSVAAPTADIERRRMRRMELARPTTAEVVERVIMGTGIAFSLRLTTSWVVGCSRFGSFALDGRDSGAGAMVSDPLVGGSVRGIRGARPGQHVVR